MPLIYKQDINEKAKLGLWEIEEDESYFASRLMLLPNIHHPHKRLQHLAGRFLLTQLYAHFPVQDIKTGDARKPFLENNGFHFSISHCGNYAAALVSETNRVGVDIESIAPKAGKLKDKFLTTAEQELLLQSFPENPYLAFTCGWSIKEAMFKWYGLGRVDFKAHFTIRHLLIDQDTKFFKGEVHIKKEREYSLGYEGKLLRNQCLIWLVA